MLVHEVPADPKSGYEGRARCHSFLEGGVWRYLPDCTHAMRGSSAPAPDWESPPSFSGMSDPEATTQVEGATAPAAPPPTAPPAAAPPATEDENAKAAAEEVKAAKEKAFANAVRAAAAPLLTACQGPELGLTQKQAALLVAHVALGQYSSPAGLATHGKTELIEWGGRLRQRNPSAWMCLKDSNVAGFVAALMLKNEKVGRLPLPKDAPAGAEHEPDLESYEHFVAILSAP